MQRWYNMSQECIPLVRENTYVPRIGSLTTKEYGSIVSTSEWVHRCAKHLLSQGVDVFTRYNLIFAKKGCERGKQPRADLRYTVKPFKFIRRCGVFRRLSKERLSVFAVKESQLIPFATLAF